MDLTWLDPLYNVCLLQALILQQQQQYRTTRFRLSTTVTDDTETIVSMSAAIQAPSQPESGRCLFFRIPRELRIEIYQHVLRYEHGLTIEYDPDGEHVALRLGNDASVTRDILPNPLTLVCRQLYNETHGILLEANSEIALHSTRFSTPSSYVFADFTKQISTTVLRRLRKITICGARNAEAETLSWGNMSSYFESFKPFCIANPDIRVILRFGMVGDVSKRGWLMTCLSVSEVIQNLRLRRLNSALPPPAIWMNALVDRIGRQTACVLRNLPQNLRYSVLAEFPEHEVAQQINESTTFLKLEHGDMELARWMWEEGI